MEDRKKVHDASNISAGNRPAPLMRVFCASPLTGEEIEAESFRIIDREAPVHRFTPDEWEVVRRLIHTTADFTLMEAIRSRPTPFPRPFRLSVPAADFMWIPT